MVDKTRDEEDGMMTAPLLQHMQSSGVDQSITMAPAGSFLDGWPLANPETGLEPEEAEVRLKHFGWNELEEKKENILLKFLSYFWNPMAIMIWVACIVEFLDEAWSDLAVLFVLQLVNGVVGFMEERKAGSAIAALKASLQPMATVKRNRRVQVLPAKYLVPGDVILIKLGDIVPADCVIIEGHVLCDQAALTGESLPVQLYPSDSVKMGSCIKTGEVEAHVTATGKHTFFGRAAMMVSQDQVEGRFSRVLFQITMILMVLAILVSIIILVSLLYRGVPVLAAVGICVVLLVASIPIAMQVVSTSTMAFGARSLARKNAVVARLSAIEELAGMSLLCSDKTGTLTMNKLKLNEPMLLGTTTKEELLLVAALAARRMEEGQDAIDFCITEEVRLHYEEVERQISGYRELEFIPFDPTNKRTEAVVEGADGSTIRVMKGAPQIVMGICRPTLTPEDEEQIRLSIFSLAERGYRSLGVAKTEPGSNALHFLGLLSLFDPPRHDTKETIQRALALGIEVKMVTGDQTAIAKETCRTLGMGVNVLDSEIFTTAGTCHSTLVECVREAHGFAEVFPEHKHEIVELLQAQGLTVGMTGDGVNDSPALKRAHIGIAVQGATDAARAAADIVLLDPGLSVIIDAVYTARKIFARVKNYCVYRIACTFQLVFFFFIAILAFDPTQSFPESQRQGRATKTFIDKEGGRTETCFYLPVLTLVLLTILNDGCILSIAKDQVVPARMPQHWNLPEIFAVSSAIGAWLVVLNVGMLAMGMSVGPGATAGSSCGQSPNDYGPDAALANTAKCEGFLPSILGSSSTGTINWVELKAILYLTLSLSGFLTIFCARTRQSFLERRPGYILLGASIFALAVTSILAHVGGTTLGIGSLDVHVLAYVWGYVVVGFLIQDLIIKRSVYACIDYLEMKSTKEHAFEERVRRATLSSSLLEPRVAARESLRSSALVVPSTASVRDSIQASLEARLMHVERYVQELEAIIHKLTSQLKVQEGEKDGDDEKGTQKRMMMKTPRPPSMPPVPAGSPLRKPAGSSPIKNVMGESTGEEEQDGSKTPTTLAAAAAPAGSTSSPSEKKTF